MRPWPRSLPCKGTAAQRCLLRAATTIPRSGSPWRGAERLQRLVLVARRRSERERCRYFVHACATDRVSADDPDRAGRFWHGVLGVTLAARPAAAGSGWQTDTEGLRLGVHERGRGPGDTASLPYFSSRLERAREYLRAGRLMPPVRPDDPRPRLSRQTQDPEATAARTWPARAVGTVAPAWMRGSRLPRTMPTAVMRSSPARRRRRARNRVMCWSSLGVGRPGAPLPARIRHRPGHDRDGRRFCQLRRGRPLRRSRPVSRLPVLC
jgi:hypothetical protein